MLSKVSSKLQSYRVFIIVYSNWIKIKTNLFNQNDISKEFFFNLIKELKTWYFLSKNTQYTKQIIYLDIFILFVIKIIFYIFIWHKN